MANYAEYIKAAGGETYQIRDSEAARKNETEKELGKKVNKQELFNLIYPVGAIYLSTTNVDPGTIFGGTWEQIKDKFLLSAGDTYAAGSTGGKTSYTLSAAIGAVDNNVHALGYITEGPIAYQKSYRPSIVVYGGSADTSATASWNHSTPVTEHSVNDRNVTIIPPYLSVYVWKRVE